MRLAESLREMAAQYLQIESNGTSLITVTRVEVLNRGKRAIVYFTVLPDSPARMTEVIQSGGEESKVLKFVQRKRSDFRKYIIDKKIVGFAPSIEFQIDIGEKNRQRIDELSNLDTQAQNL